jgi:hypothetical protein
MEAIDFLISKFTTPTLANLAIANDTKNKVLIDCYRLSKVFPGDLFELYSFRPKKPIVHKITQNELDKMDVDTTILLTSAAERTKLFKLYPINNGDYVKINDVLYKAMYNTLFVRPPNGLVAFKDYLPTEDFNGKDTFTVAPEILVLFKMLNKPGHFSSVCYRGYVLAVPKTRLQSNRVLTGKSDFDGHLPIILLN